MIQEREDKAVIPNAPDVRNPATANAMVRAAGTRTGLQITKSGVVRVKPISVPVRVSPERTRKKPPIGTPATTARICCLEGPFSWRSPLGSPPGRC